MKLGRLVIKKEWRQLHTGIGHKQGCGSDFRARYFVILWNGAVKLEQILKLEYKLNLKDRLERSSRG